MATQIYVNGPAYIQVGTGASGVLQHLGWSESGVDIEVNAENEDVMTDLMGNKIGTDVIYLGQEAIITATLVRYDEAVLSGLLARLNGGVAGFVGPGDIGSLMLQQAYTHRLLIGAPYQTITAFSSMTAAYNFPTAYILGSAKIEVGTKVKKARLTWRALVKPVLSGGMADGTLMNNSTTGVATIA